MTRADVIISLARGGLYNGHWRLPDLSYDAIAPEFVAEAWPAWVASLPPELRELRQIGGGATRWFPRWISEVFDCDDIAAQFAAFIERCMAVDAVRNGTTRGGAAAGTFDFLLGADPTKGHCRNWFIDHDNVAHTFDAGNATFDTETPAERAIILEGEAA